MSSTAIRPRPDEDGDRFRHEALFYAGTDDFLAKAMPFILAGVEAGEPILVLVNAEKIDRLRAELDGSSDRVRFADMATVGLNPARIIPTWRAFVAEHRASGAPFRGIGEPIWAERSRDELDECERHEALLNVAFDGTPAWWLACPYDTESLPAAVLEEAERNHPFVVHDDIRRPSRAYRGVDRASAPDERPLSAPPEATRQVRSDPTTASLRELRAVVAEEAARTGLGPSRTDDLVLAASEVATNSIRHGEGLGVLRLWSDGDALVCEISDSGRIVGPLVGRDPPTGDLESGYGLWLANHVCDLVQIRTFPSGSIVRLHVRR